MCNNEADGLARTGLEIQPAGPEISPISVRSASGSARATNLHQKYWTSVLHSCSQPNFPSYTWRQEKTTTTSHFSLTLLYKLNFYPLYCNICNTEQRAQNIIIFQVFFGNYEYVSSTRDSFVSFGTVVGTFLSNLPSSNK